MSSNVLYASADVVVVDKPAGISTEPGRDGSLSLRDEVAAWLESEARGEAARAPHAVSRLDTNVSGAVTFAVSARGAKHLADQLSRGTMTKRYVAVASGKLDGAGLWSAPVANKPARSRYTAVDQTSHAKGIATLLLVEPLTGRMHQLRIHASSAGAPLIGDRRYGGPARITDRSGRVVNVDRVLLHAHVVELDDGGERIRAVSPIPELFHEVWRLLDGRPKAWEELSAACGD
jgi:23S rRNA-/tRNA-specific pseudouridylate synthase